MKSNAAPSTQVGILTLVLTLLGWSSVPLFLRHFAHLIDFWTSNGWRYGFSALVWAPVLIVVMFRRQMPRGLWKAALVPSIANAAGQVCFTWAHYRIEPGLLTFGLRSQLLFVAIGAWIMFPTERAIIRRPGYLIGAAVLLAGMSVVMLLAENHDAPITAPQSPPSDIATAPDDATSPNATGLASSHDPSAHVQGVLLAIASGLLFACSGLAVRKYMHGVNSVIAFAAICQYTALVMVALMLVLGNRGGLTVLDLAGGEFAMLLGSALIGIAIGHVFYYFSIARLGVAITAGVLQLQPFIVAMASLSLFGERLTASQWIGGCVAVSGAMMMLAVQWRVSRRAPVLEEPIAIAEGESGS